MQNGHEGLPGCRSGVSLHSSTTSFTSDGTSYRPLLTQSWHRRTRPRSRCWYPRYLVTPQAPPIEENLVVLLQRALRRARSSVHPRLPITWTQHRLLRAAAVACGSVFAYGDDGGGLGQRDVLAHARGHCPLGRHGSGRRELCARVPSDDDIYHLSPPPAGQRRLGRRPPERPQRVCAAPRRWRGTCDRVPR